MYCHSIGWCIGKCLYTECSYQRSEVPWYYHIGGYVKSRGGGTGFVGTSSHQTYRRDISESADGRATGS